MSTIEEQQDDLNTTLKRFRDLETMGITSRPVRDPPDEMVAWRKVSESMKFDNDHYVIAVSWRDDRPSLQKNRPLADKRLKSTERKLVKGPAIAEAYQKKITEEYLGKEQICRVSPNEPTPTLEYYGFFVVAWILESSSSIDVIFSALPN